MNAEIIKRGYGRAYTRFPFKYLEEFRQYEKEARENEIGLWAPK
ncbi:MAG: thermonuclease family protein [Candidatus Omnitrophica bacterium]|nr:thermonuclease family protein [Candidatus Omnitrophota bacterium]